MAYTVNGEDLETDDEGFLLEANFGDEVVPVIAAAEEIELTDAHWQVIRFMRERYKVAGLPKPFGKGGY